MPEATLRSPAPVTWPLPPERPPVVWGEWTTHHDTAGAVATMATRSDPSGLALTATFAALGMQLEGSGELAASVSLAGHLPVAFPLGIPLAGFQVVVQGLVGRTPGTSVVVSLTVGTEVRSVAYAPIPVRHDPEGDDEGSSAVAAELVLLCMSPDQQIVRSTEADPTGPGVADPLPPLTLALDVHVRRQTVDDVVDITIDSLDLEVLLQN